MYVFVCELYNLVVFAYGLTYHFWSLLVLGLALFDDLELTGKIKRGQTALVTLKHTAKSKKIKK